MKITYHAWLRERLQICEETLSLPEPISLQDIVHLLIKRHNFSHDIFENQQSLRFAINHVLCKDMSTILQDNDILSIFPPFTGG